MERELIFALVRAFFWLGGAVYICGGIWFPAWFGRSFSLEAWFSPPRRFGEIDREPRWIRFAIGPWIVIGLGVFVYYAVFPIIDAIPFDWGSYDEEGEWTSTRDYIRFALTLVGMLALMDTLEKRGIEAHREQMRQFEERKRKWESM